MADDLTDWQKSQKERLDELTLEYQGKEATPELRKTIYELYGVRIDEVGYAITMDVQPFRLNMRVDENNIIQGFFFG